MFVPLSVPFQLVGIAGVQSPEDNGLAIGGDEMIAFDADPAGLRKSSRGKQHCTQPAENNFIHDMVHNTPFSVPPGPRKLRAIGGAFPNTRATHGTGLSIRRLLAGSDPRGLPA